MVNIGSMWTIRSYHLPVIRLHTLNVFLRGPYNRLRVARDYKILTSSLNIDNCETEFMFIALIER